MCWSGEASFTLATLGFAGAYWSHKKGHEPFRWMPLAYFSVMETLQGITYSYIGECGQTANMALTYLSYLHIAFQPFFVNMLAMSWISKEARKHLAWVWPVCIFASAIFLLRLTDRAVWGDCDPLLQMMCGAEVCSAKGDWHIAWTLKLNNLDPYYMTYEISCFVVPFAYGSWRFSTYHFLVGPLLAWSLTGNKDERAAIWCLLSIGFLSAAHIPFISRLLTAREKKPAEPVHN